MDDFTNKLGDYIRFMYKNEEEFIKKFFPNKLTAEVLEFYMASTRCKIIMQIASPAHIEQIHTTVRTAEFIDWCDDNKGVLL